MTEMTTYPNATLAVMVNKRFVERVLNYLFWTEDDIGWVTRKHHPKDHPADTTASPSTNVTPLKRQIDDDEDVITAVETTDQKEPMYRTHPNVTLLGETDKVGVSHVRRGYLLLLVEHCERPIDKISPMARQNISWVAPIRHRWNFQVAVAKSFNNALEEEEIKEDNSSRAKNSEGPTPRLTFAKIQELSERIWKSFPSKVISDFQSSSAKKEDQALRVDVYPREYVNNFCLGLQQACHRDTTTTPQSSPSEIPSEPFEGPIPMTMSASKCSHRLTIILSEPTTTTTTSQNHGDCMTYDLFWGLMEREKDDSIMKLKLNHQANEEINVVASDRDTGGEVPSNVHVPIEAPLSRAYYKLDQVWTDYLEPEQHLLAVIRKLEASAVDFGSSPGGWTQVLAHRAKDLVKSVVTVDRGIVADRVAKLPHVHFIHGLIDDCQAKIEPHGPFSIVVCDASRTWSEIMKSFTKVVVHRSSSSESESNDCNSKFTLPCVFCITMKLPYLSPKSIQRHVDQINNNLPHYLSEMAAAMYPTQPVQTRSLVTHLMANSDGERTIIAIFEPCCTSS